MAVLKAPMPWFEIEDFRIGTSKTSVSVVYLGQRNKDAEALRQQPSARVSRRFPVTDPQYTSDPRKWSIYALIDPRTEEVRYVGWSFDPQRRLRHHLRYATKEHTHKAAWLRQILALSLPPRLEILEAGTGDWAAAERKWIAHFRGAGARLTNLTDGGDGMPGYRWTDEQKQRLQQREFSPEHRANIASAKTGIPLSEIHRRILSEQRRGRPLSEEHRARLVAAHTGKPLSPEHRAKISAALRGRKWTPEQRALLSRQRKGLSRGPLSDETKRKIGDARRGKPGTPWTDEHRRNVALARQRRKEALDA